MLINKEFWKDKKVFITGHTGFKGGWLSLWLKNLGAEITGYSLPPLTEPSLFELAHIGKNINSIIADILDLARLKHEIHQAQPDIIFHLAAQSLVRQSYHEPLETYAVNVMGTANLLEAIRSTPTVRSVIIVTSDKCYENLELEKGYTENDAMGGYDPYSSSKGCAELITSAYRNSFFNPKKYAEHKVAIASVRAGNVIGGGDWSVDRLIPDLIRSIVAKKEVVIRNPSSTRPWQHVLEPLSGYIKLAELLYTNGTEFGEGWNFGHQVEEAKTVKWIIDNFSQMWGDGLKYRIESDAANMHEAHYLRLNCEKAEKKMGWRANLSLDETIQNVCAWYKDYLAGKNIYEVTIKQIEEYERKVDAYYKEQQV